MSNLMKTLTIGSSTYEVCDAIAREQISNISDGNVNLKGYATEQFVHDSFQPKGDYLTEVPEGYAKTEDIPDPYTLPVGGDALGGVKNGGNVVINSDGTMTTQACSWNDLKDKPFYKENIAVMYENPEFWIDAEGYGFAADAVNFLETGETYEVEFNGNHYTCTCTEQRYGDQIVRTIVGDDVRISQNEGSDGFTVIADAEVIYNVFAPLKITKIAIKQLDSKYVDLSGYAKTEDIPDAYTLPVGGDALGGVKNGGNVVINADGTMTATEAGGGSGVSSWNELKDKPFYDETAVLYENPALYVEEDSASENITTNFLEEGETYTVEVDGKPYSLVCEISDDMEFTGNVYYCLTSDNFEVYTALPDLTFEFYSKNYNNKTISLKISKPSIKKIDNKYLPEHLQFGDESVVLYENPALWIDEESMAVIYDVGADFLVEDETYEVECNGNHYTCVCTLKESYGGGKYHLIDFGDTSITQHAGDDYFFVSSIEFYEETISLKISKPSIKKIDNKYLDLTSYATEEWVGGNYQPKGDYLTAVPDGYAQKSEIPTKVSQLENDSGYLTEHQSLDGLATETYVNTQIAAIPTPDVSGQINTHNTATDSHNDIRLLVDGLTTRLNTLANSDDTTLDQMSEVVAYIKNNKSLIEGVTNSKVNVSDIIDNLTTNVSNKPLSAAQGAALKALIDAIVVPTKVSQLENDSKYLTSIPSEYVTESELNAKKYLTSYTETDPTVPSWAKQPEKPSYTASEVGALPNTTVIPDALSDLTDDTTHRLVTDTEKSSWNAKAEVSAIPTKVSQLTNDSKFLTSFTESDPTVPAWAKQSTKPTYTKSEVGLSNVDNTSDANKPVSTAQATAIADAKKAGTDAQSNLTTHINNKSNPHGVTASQVGADASGTAESKVSAHNEDTMAHTGIREQISQLSLEIANIPSEIYIGSGTPANDEKIQIDPNGEGNTFTIPDVLQTTGTSTVDTMSQKAITDALNSIESGGVTDGQIASAVEAYLTENPIEGINGRGISSVARTSGNGAAGTTDTYTIKYTDNTTSTFTVYNGKDGTNGTNGKSAYSYAQDGGFTGTEAAFTTALAATASYTTETWTFTLEDGSIVTKAVVIG